MTADDELYCISSTAAVNEASKLKNKENKSLQLTKAGAEDLISRFVQDKWLNRSKYVFFHFFFSLVVYRNEFLEPNY